MTEQDGLARGPAAGARGSSTFSPRVLLASALTLCAGLVVAWVDTRPGWDDTGVTAGAVLVTAAVGALAGVPPWLAAALAAGPIVAAEISGGTGVLLAIPFALVGAYAGAFGRRSILRR